jgi:hypothetical protein
LLRSQAGENSTRCLRCYVAIMGLLPPPMAGE